MTFLNKFPLIKVAAFAGAALVSAALGRADSIDFDTGSDGSSVGGFYAGQGVVFTNTTFTNNLGLVGSSGGLGVRATNNGGYGNVFEWDQANAVVATIAGGASSVGITGLDVGTAGIRIDAYDAVTGGSLVAFDQAFGGGAGVGYYFNLFTSSAAIMRVEIYQLFPGGGEGIILDNFIFEPSVVPDVGSTFALMIGGLLSIAALRRKLV